MHCLMHAMDKILIVYRTFYLQKNAPMTGCKISPFNISNILMKHFWFKPLKITSEK